ncbi:MAG: hypothetical protein Q9228_005948 [Teloschistes exilis]
MAPKNAVGNSIIGLDIIHPDYGVVTATALSSKFCVSQSIITSQEAYPRGCTRAGKV